MSSLTSLDRARLLPKQEVRHGVKHTIKTEGPPCHSKFRRLSPRKLKALRKELELFFEPPSKSPYSSPVYLAQKIRQKGDVKYRLVGDYNCLNDSTVADRYPLPHIYDICQTLRGKTVFSVVDLERAFYSVRHRTTTHYSLPPTSQWNDRMLAQAAQNRFGILQVKLDRCFAVSIARFKKCNSSRIIRIRNALRYDNTYSRSYDGKTFT